MLQEASTHLIVSEPSDDLIVNEPWSIDIYADGLMDELFSDIDHLLDGSGNLPATMRHSNHLRGNRFAPLPASEYLPLQTVTVPQVVLPNTFNQAVKTVAHTRNKQLSRVTVGTSAVKPVSKRQKTKRALGKLLIVGTTLGVAIASVIYLLQSGVIHLLNTRSIQSELPAPQSQLPTKSEIQAELVDYMLGALAVIDKQEADTNQESVKPRLSDDANSNKTALAFASTPPTANLPSPLAANGTPPAPSRSGSVVERIYIPVYQAPSPMRYVLPAIPGRSTLPSVATTTQGSQPQAVKTALNTVPKVAKPLTVNMLATAVQPELKPVAVRNAPISVRQPSNPLPALPVAPLRAAPTAEAPTITQEQVFTPVAVAPSNTLEGLLELGNKSAALFKIDGVTRRVDMGESIGASGWTLVDVNKGEAIIRRNGEVRSIYAGQKL